MKKCVIFLLLLLFGVLAVKAADGKESDPRYREYIQERFRKEQKEILWRQSTKTNPESLANPAAVDISLVAGSDYSKTDSFGDLVLSGAVINNGSTTSLYTKVRVNLYNSANTLLGTDWTYILGGTNVKTNADNFTNALKSGEKGFFELNTLYETATVDHWTFAFEWEVYSYSECHADLSFDGVPVFANDGGDLKISGLIMNTGSDYVTYFTKVYFAIYNSSGQVIAVEGSYVDGDTYDYGIGATATAIYPGQSQPFQIYTNTSYYQYHSYEYSFEWQEAYTTVIPDVLRITSPNGGESWEGGTQHTITWTTQGAINTVKLEYSTNNGSSWTAINNSLYNSGTYNWQIPDRDSSQCLVRVTDTNNGNTSDVSNAVFTITPEPRMYITEPGDETSPNWKVGTSHEISWNTVAITGDIAILLTDRDENLITTITASIAYDASPYYYTVPADFLPGLYAIKIQQGDLSDTQNIIIYVDPDLSLVSLVQDIREGESGSGISELTVFNNKLYFRAYNGTSSNLWFCDGVNPPQVETDLVNALGALPYDLTVGNGLLYFTSAKKLYYWDGTNPPQNAGAVSNYGVIDMAPFQGKLVFSASDGAMGRELWEYDGINPPYVVANVWPGHYDDHSLEYMTEFNNKLYFGAQDGINGQELWVYDGTNPPSMVANINSSTSPGCVISYLTVYNNKLYFQASDGTNGQELWVYDGTNPPTMVADIRANGSSSPEYLTVYHNKLYFSANDGTHGWELWVYDGSNPPAMVADSRVGSNSSTPRKFCVFNEKLFYRAFDDGLYGNEIYEYDEINPPKMIADIYPGNSPSYIDSLTPFYNKLYFIADDGTHGKELWTYNGYGLAIVTTDLPTAITATSAASGGTVTENGGDPVTVRGVCWSISRSPTLSNNFSTDGSGTGAFTSSITGLTPGSTYYIRSYATNSAGTSYGFERSFTTLAPFITVTSPNGGENWEEGSSSDITWTGSGISGDVKIEFSANSGGSWTEIIASTENDGSHPWTVPSQVSDQCLIRVSESIGSLTDTSDAVFSIVPAPSITVTSPDGGESWQVGSSHSITWTSAGIVGNVQIEYSTDNGGNWTDVITSTVNDGTHSWTVPDAVSSECLIRIGEADGNPVDTSDSLFSIVPVPAVTVTSPNGGEEWDIGATHDITWTAVGISGNVTIDLYKGGSFDSNIGEEEADSGVLSWAIPGDFPTGSDYQVRIYQDAVQDTSDSDFSVIIPSPFKAIPDFNRDGQGDLIWRYDDPAGYNAVWLLGAQASDLTGASDSSCTIGMKGWAGMLFPTAKEIAPEHTWEFASALQTEPVLDGFAGEVHGNHLSGKTPDPFTVDNPSNQGISRMMASTVSDPREDTQAVELMGVANQNWKIVAYGDFNADGKVDIVWSNVDNAQNCVWYMDGTEFVGYGRLPDGSTVDWVLGGVGDFDLDGHPDMIWNNVVDGRNGVWYLEGLQIKRIEIMTTGANVVWKLCGTGDFNSDGKVDVVWRNSSDGRNAVWYMEGAQMTSVGWLDPVANLDWSLRGTGDFNGDGKTDLIWTNVADGRNCVWYLDGITLLGVEFITTVTDTDWKIEN
jgi:ELWxxDGT repeat protein